MTLTELTIIKPDLDDWTVKDFGLLDERGKLLALVEMGKRPRKVVKFQSTISKKENYKFHE
jgi:hypothetical protein